MPSLIPAFPLGMVCFPGEIQNLHIFEHRYRDLTNDCIEDKIHFCLVPYVNNKAFHMATEVSLHKVHTKYPDGKYDISIKGEQLVKVHRLFKKYPDKEYPGVKASHLSWYEDYDENKSILLLERINELYNLLKIDTLEESILEGPFLVRQVVHKIGLTIEQELHLLTLAHEWERQDYVLNHLADLIPHVKSTNDLRMKAALNGHFKNITPPNF